MSFLTEAVSRRVFALQVPRTVAISAPRASFSTSVLLQKSAVEAAKDGLKTVDRAVSDKIVDGIDASANVADKVKAASQDLYQNGAASGTANEAQGKAAELKGEAQGKANELAGKAKGAAAEAKGEIKGEFNKRT